jgi:periplasmic copper chaperone A
MKMISCLSTAALLGLAFAQPVANAHVTLEKSEASVGASYKATFRVPHGCDGSATTKVRVTIPEGVIAVKPMPKPGWAIESVRGPYAKAYKRSHGPELSEGVREVIWSGNLPDAYYDEFILTAFLTDDLKADSRLSFPVVQECEKGIARWTEIAGEGQDRQALKMPAPGVMLLAQAASGSMPQRVTRAGNLQVGGGWSRATPGGAKVAGGYVRITNVGKEPDRLIGGSLSRAGRVEIHEMAVTDGVMRMRPLANGLEIKPGETVELKPGGLHIMFMDLSGPLKAGEAIPGTLVFEKAGTVEITFQVTSAGGQKEQHHHRH